VNVPCGSSTHVVPEAEHLREEIDPEPQQVWFSPPQVPHDPPAMHRPGTDPQKVPTAMQRGVSGALSFSTQQLPSVQTWPAQQMVGASLVPAVPHRSHLPG
jgi:hypothetical protein